MRIRVPGSFPTSYVIAGLLAVVAVLWILSGLVGGADGTAEEGPPPAAVESDEAPMMVRVREQSAEPHVRRIVLRGQTEASRSVEIKAETAGKVEIVSAKEGRPVDQGQVLVELAHDERDAQLAEARALVRQRQAEYDAGSKLAKKGYRAETQLAASRAQLDAARAALKAIEVEISHTAIKAPFDGILKSRFVEVGDFVDIGNPIAEIIDLDPLLVVAQVSEQRIGKLALDSPASARLVTGQTVAGRVTYIANSADPDTRTFRVEIEVANPDRSLSDGVTAEIVLGVDRMMAHRVSPAVLTLNDKGEVGIKVVNDDDVVEFHPVDIAADTADGMWLTGLPETIEVIVVGQEFVKAGEKVRPVPEGTQPTS